jgi:hypothetical protein
MCSGHQTLDEGEPKEKEEPRRTGNPEVLVHEQQIWLSSVMKLAISSCRTTKGRLSNDSAAVNDWE